MNVTYTQIKNLSKQDKKRMKRFVRDLLTPIRKEQENAKLRQVQNQQLRAKV